MGLMSKQHIEALIHEAAARLQQTGKFSFESRRVQIDIPKDRQHGEISSNIALILAKNCPM